MRSFGKLIREARRRKGLNQKDLAARITKADGTAISQQYVVDLELGHRNPPSDDMVVQFAAELDVDSDLLLVAAGRLPSDIRERLVSEPDRARRVFGELRDQRRDRRRLG